MIHRVKYTKHGYIMSDATNEEFQKLLKGYPDKVRCVICNKDTAKQFRIGLLGRSIITINNKVPDDVIFINHYF